VQSLQKASKSSCEDKLSKGGIEMKLKCSNSKNHRANGFARQNNKPVKDCQILNEMIGRDVCKSGNVLCIDCIPLYYKKTFDEIREGEI